MKQIFIITCNDFVKHVVLGTQEQAEMKRDELKAAYIEEHAAFFERINPDDYTLWEVRQSTFTKYP